MSWERACLTGSMYKGLIKHAVIMKKRWKILGLANLLLIFPGWFHAVILCIPEQNLSAISKFSHGFDFGSPMGFEGILVPILLLKSESGFLLSGAWECELFQCNIWYSLDNFLIWKQIYDRERSWEGRGVNGLLTLLRSCWTGNNFVLHYLTFIGK